MNWRPSTGSTRRPRRRGSTSSPTRACWTSAAASGCWLAARSRATLLARRRAGFTGRYVEPLLTEAARLGIDSDELIALIKECGTSGEVSPYDTGDLGDRADPEIPRPGCP